MNAQVKEKLSPINTKDFGMTTHRHRDFDADVPAGTQLEDIENPELWVNVARQLSIGDEVRVIPEDHAFYARALVVHAVGSQVLMKIIASKEFESEGEVKGIESPFFVALRGRKRYCLIERSSGIVIKEGIASLSLAHQELEDHMRALSN